MDSIVIKPEHKHKDKYEQAIVQAKLVLNGFRLANAKKQSFANVFQSFIDDSIVAIHLQRIINLCSWMSPDMFMSTIIIAVETNRSNWYAAHWLHKSSS